MKLCIVWVHVDKPAAAFDLPSQEFDHLILPMKFDPA
jgi:hypothetical protein